ncbi:MAG: ArsR family transcriptional regulator, partial [Candidatus Nitrosotenuis sp.]
LRKETSKRVLVFLLNNKSVTFSQILKHVKKSPPTISFVLSNLLELKLIGLAPGIYKKYYLYDRETTATALKQIDPSLFDTMKDRFADAFSYF